MTTSAPRVSVIVSTFNGQRYIRRTIEALLCQTLRDLELIIVDDGSTDDTRRIIRGIEDDRIVLLHNDRNLGIAASQNRALSFAKGGYIALQDHDDLSVPGRLELQASFLDRNPNTAVVGSSALVVDELGSTVSLWTVPLQDVDLRWRLLFGNPFLHTSLMLRRAAIDHVGWYCEEECYRFAEDYELLSRLASAYQMANMSAPLVSWRSHTASASSANRAAQGEAAARVRCRNMQELLGEQTIDGSSRSALLALFYSKAGENSAISSHDVSAALHLVHRLQRAFYRRRGFPDRLVACHARRLHWSRGKHLVALACRASRQQGLAYRMMLLGHGGQYLYKALLPGRLSPRAAAAAIRSLDDAPVTPRTED